MLYILLIYLGHIFLKQKHQKFTNMIPMLAERFGAQRWSYIMFSIGQVLFPLSFIYVNDHKFSFIETNLVRGIASVILNYAIIRYYEMGVDFKYTINFVNLIKRNIIIVIHGLAITQAQFYLPLPIVHTINFCAPIFIFIIDYFENGVRITKIQFYFLFLGIIGILCTINDELISKLINKSYEFKTEFKNYIHTDPQQFATYSLCLCGVMFFWAYALLRVRTFYKNNHTHVNFHLGVLFLISSGFLYPNIITQKTDLYKMFIALFVTGLPLALSQLCSTASLGLNKKTGQLIILTGIPILIGYLLSYIRYGETIQFMELLGTSLIFIGLMGVIHCGESQALNNQIPKPSQTEKLINDTSLMPVQVMLNTIKIA